MEYILSIIIGFLFGSFPTAYVVLKVAKGLDITKIGSKNVGTLNSYETTKSKPIAVIVLIFDLLKGLLASLLPKILFGDYFIFAMLGLVSAVLFHCYSPWIKFKGGRGLATAAGGSFIISIPVFIIWVVFWIVSFLFRKNIHFSNFAATVLTAAISITSGNILNKYSQLQAESSITFSIMVVLMMLIIVSKHIQPMKEYLLEQKQKRKVSL
ncbi:glycerol-3-phosphate acyltransferase [Melioribacteraceae bacterium 4301-Me]|uniref:glycerol-3-phosphate acyltransferase n=1 Tax=Pyranulibacter aquaticus TaxID=3163344 RepID=UPI00359C0C08